MLSVFHAWIKMSQCSILNVAKLILFPPFLIDANSFHIVWVNLSLTTANIVRKCRQWMRCIGLPDVQKIHKIIMYIPIFHKNTINAMQPQLYYKVITNTYTRLLSWVPILKSIDLLLRYNKIEISAKINRYLSENLWSIK